MIDQLTLNIRLNPETTLEAYLPDEGQGELVDSVKALVHGQHDVPQLFFWGASSTGKTHLAQAACHLAATYGMTCAYLPLKELSDWGPSVLEDLSAVQILALDDLDRVWESPSWQVALFALINEVRESGGRLLLTASSRPGDVEVNLADLRSRLLWGAVFHLRRLDDRRLGQLLREGAHSRGFSLGQKETAYLLRHAVREPGTLTMLLDRLDMASLKACRRVTIPLIREVLAQNRTEG